MPKNSQIIPQILAAIFILLSCWPIFLYCSNIIEMPLTLLEWFNIEYINLISFCNGLVMNIIFVVFIAYFHRRYKSRTTTIAFVFSILWFVFYIAVSGFEKYMIFKDHWAYWHMSQSYYIYNGSTKFLVYIFFTITISFFAESLKHDTFVLATTIGLILITNPILWGITVPLIGDFGLHHAFSIFAIAIDIAKNMFLFAACLAEAPDAESKIKEHNNALK